MDIRGVTARERLRSMLVEKMNQELLASKPSQAGTSEAGAVQPNDKDLSVCLETKMAGTKADDLVKTKVKKKQYGRKSCSASGCKVIYDKSSKQQGITSHSFPWSKPDLVKKWEDAMGRTAFKATVHSRVCSNHFIPDSFDRTGLRVRLKSGAVPTIFELPGHKLNPIQHQHPLAERNGDELTATKMSKPITSSAVEHSYSPVLEPFCKRLKKCNSAIGTNAVSVESEATSNVTIPPFKLRVCNGHNYSLPNPRVVKNKLGIMESALAQYRHKVRILRQKNRRLELKVKSLQQLLGNLRQKDLISQQAADKSLQQLLGNLHQKNLISRQAAENIQSSFSMPILQLISRMLKGKSRHGDKFPDELKAFALTLQFYSPRAYSYVRKAFNLCLPHPRTLKHMRNTPAENTEDSG